MDVRNDDGYVVSVAVLTACIAENLLHVTGVSQLYFVLSSTYFSVYMRCHLTTPF